MSDERCETTDLLVDQCAHCRPVDLGRSWPAKFEAVCAWTTCLQVIDVGEEVRWSEEGSRVQHARHGTRRT
jgi:hypothetical protein